MDETKVQISEDVLLDIGIHSDWYISAVGYNGESVDVVLRRKADEECKWWLADTPQTETHDCERYVITNDEGEKAYGCMGCQMDCPWK